MTLLDIFRWDVTTWSRALPVWKSVLEAAHPPLLYGLEIGASNGGVSAYFARTYGCKMLCSDLDLSIEKVGSFHRQVGVAHLVDYQIISATDIPYPAATFDFVVFKSVLGAIGPAGSGEYAEQQKAIREMHRVLKPGGVLFFAENLTGSWLHRFARRHFVAWGKSWRYVTLPEMQTFLQVFSQYDLRATGFLAAFVSRPAWLKEAAAWLDTSLPFPKSWRYVAYGYAVKES